ncbi:MAG: phosphatase PAP2 family protein [Nonlabens sp.]
MWESIVDLDRRAFKFLNSLGIDDYDQFWLFVTQIENWIPLYLLFFYLLYRNVERPNNFFSIAGIPAVAIITLQLTNLVKNFIERLRPNNEPMLMDSIRILQRPENFSFWSGHSAVSFAVTTFVVLCLKSRSGSKWYYLFYIWPFTFAISRIFVGVHYPADVTVGMLVGMLLGYGSFKLLETLTKRGKG